VTCVEFTFFQANGGTGLMSQEIVVGKESEKPTRVTSGSLPVVTEDAFLNSLDENGRTVFAEILALAKRKSMPVHWGTKGFSLNVDVDGSHVAICFVYPPESVLKQTFRTALRDSGGVGKTAVPEDIVQTLCEQAKSTGLFSPAGRELKCRVNHQFSELEVQALLSWCESVENAVKRHGLRE